MRTSSRPPSSLKPFLSYQIRTDPAPLTVQPPADSPAVSPHRASRLSADALLGDLGVWSTFHGDFLMEIE